MRWSCLLGGMGFRKMSYNMRRICIPGAGFGTAAYVASTVLWITRCSKALSRPFFTMQERCRTNVGTVNLNIIDIAAITCCLIYNFDLPSLIWSTTMVDSTGLWIMKSCLINVLKWTDTRRNAKSLQKEAYCFSGCATF